MREHAGDNRPNCGFTLMEILIVVIILGILAAIVLPQVANSTNDTKLTVIQRDIQAVQEQLEMYRFQTSSEPSLNTFWTQLGTSQVVNGSTVGPWICWNPVNPFLGGTAVASVDAGVTPSGPWAYDSAMNKFYGNANGTWLPAQ